ncbi:MAG: hypothetical protein WD766_02375, partial [Gemmatimonadota bacterium]
STWMSSTNVTPETINPVLLAADSAPLSESVRVSALLRRPNVSLMAVLEAIGENPLEVSAAHDRDEVLAGVEMELRYAGYLERERKRAEALRRQDDFELPEELAYAELKTLSTEARQKLERVRPRTLGQAGRVPGISPSDLQNLVMEVRKRRGRAAAERGG